MPVPHPIPYQGSKRLLAAQILAASGPRHFNTFHEPFAGSAAVTLAASARGLADRYVLADELGPLAELWERILSNPLALATEYEALWSTQIGGAAAHYLAVRDTFNAHGGAAHLLYLLARCVKNSPRFNAAGAFNQSADHRRRGTRPERMRTQLVGASRLLAGRTQVRHADFATVIAQATPTDLVYLDPPWEGTSAGPDRRYRSGLSRPRLIAALEDLHARDIPYLLSYDGRHGERRYGAPLPASIGAERIELAAGRSSQATLHGRSVTTYESLYVSAGLRAGGLATAA